MADAEVKFFDLLNHHRARAGKPTLARSSAMDAIALDWSMTMGGRYIAGLPVNTSDPKCNLSSLCHRPDLGRQIAAAVPDWKSGGENVGVGGDIVRLDAAFRNSKQHYANIIGNFDHVGIGVVKANGATWVTFNFLRLDRGKGPALGPALESTPEGNETALTTAGPSTFEPVRSRRIYDGRIESHSTDVIVDLRDPELLRSEIGMSTARGAVLNVTATNAKAAGYVKAWPCGTSEPPTSNLNFTPTTDVATMVLLPSIPDGKLCLRSSTDVDLIVDLNGRIGTGGGRPVTLSPTRVLDSRSTGVSQNFSVDLRSALPAGATGALINVTVDQPAAGGFLVAYPCADGVPLASNLNFAAGRPTPNTVLVKVSDGPTCFNASTQTHLIVDVVGAVEQGEGGEALTVSSPLRVVDTRTGVGGWAGILDVGQVVRVPFGVRHAETIVALNVTSVSMSGEAGYVTVWPCSEPRPTTSNVNVDPSQTASNAVVASTDGNGDVCLWPSTRMDLIVDLFGGFRV